jgi:hypothetical protein
VRASSGSKVSSPSWSSMWGSSRATMLVPLDLRLTIRPLEDASCFEGFRSGSIDDNEALVGGEAGGCACDCDAVVVGMGAGLEADIAAPFVRACVCSRD